MAKVRASTDTPIYMLIISDFLGFLLSTLPVTAAYAITIALLVNSFGSTTFWILILFSPYMVSISMMLILALFRIILPAVKAGKYKVGFTKGFIAWSFNLCLNRCIDFSGLKKFIFAHNTLRFLYLRVMGAKVPFRMNISSGVEFVDLPLISIGEGCTLGEGAYFSAHSFTGDLLMLQPVKIENNVFIGMEVIVGPGTEIGERSWIGTQNKFIHDKIPAESLLPNFVWIQGNPERMEKSKARLGNPSNS